MSIGDVSGAAQPSKNASNRQILDGAIERLESALKKSLPQSLGKKYGFSE